MPSGPIKDLGPCSGIEGLFQKQGQRVVPVPGRSQTMDSAPSTATLPEASGEGTEDGLSTTDAEISRPPHSSSERFPIFPLTVQHTTACLLSLPGTRPEPELSFLSEAGSRNGGPRSIQRGRRGACQMQSL